MNDRQLVAALTRAGFKGPSLKTAYAVAKAESGGRPRAFNPDASTGDRSYGLFQINMLGGLGPARRKQYGLSSNEDLYDPDTNARIAYRMSGGGKDWSPWSAYKSGAYEKYLGNVPAPARGGPPAPTPGGGSRRSASPAGFKLPKSQIGGRPERRAAHGRAAPGAQAERGHRVRHVVPGAAAAVRELDCPRSRSS